MTLKNFMLSFTGFVLLALLATAARADDTEIFFNQANANIGANVLLILDTSGSMDDEVKSVNPYDGTATYPGTCDSNYFYYVKSGTPTCTATNRVPVANFKCASAKTQLGSSSDATGSFADAFVRWGKVSTKKGSVTTTAYQWTNNLAVSNASDVDCLTDAGVDGNGDASLLYPTKKTDPASANGIWSIQTDSWWLVSGNQGTSVTFYSASYINYLNDPAQTVIQTKLKIMQDAIKSLLGSVQGVNVGLMRYDSGGNGGMVTNAVAPIATNATPISNSVASWAATGSTPLTKTLYEAYLYFSQGGVNFGTSSKGSTCSATSVNANGATHCTAWTTPAFPSVAASRKGGSASSKTYDSPADLSCQKNYIIFLTDGQSNNTDTAINTTIKGLTNFTALGGACDATTPPGANGGQCLAALAQYMQKADLRTDVDQTQNVTSYFIGFGDTFKTDANAKAYYDYLDAAAKRGGSANAFTATSLSELSLVFNQIFNEVQNTNTSFSAPAVAVNAFNRTQTLDDIYVSVFAPRGSYHWPGNVKKYKVTDGVVNDRNGDPAVEPSTGFFKKSAQSFWSAQPDGEDVTKGGAASNLPDPTARVLYTYLGTNPATPPVAVVGIGTATNADFNITGVAPDPTRVDLINWAKGVDVNDNINGVSNGNSTETRFEMGDPIHTQPAVVIYGTGTDDTVLYTPTNDGYLHAIDGETGIEKWAFIPKQMLDKLKLLYADDDTVTKHYALDGQITVLKYDVDGNGKVDVGAGDKVLIFFGTGRNADVQGYYALDVTDKNNPKFQWFIDSSVLPDLGQAWSTPTVARVNINGATQNTQKLVLIFGGGYDPIEDGYSYVPSDSLGNHIYMVDALKGTLLWSAGSSGSSKLQLARMTHSIPSPVTVLDTNGDGYADRMYVGDMAGQVWRFDIFNGQNDSNLVTGGVMASLGSKEETTHLAANTRRFYSGPDVAAIQMSAAPTFLNIAIGSGYRGHPLDSGTVDRLYSLRDYNPFNQLSQTSYNTLMNATNLVLDSTLQDITADNAAVVPTLSKGWKLVLNTHSIGEKSLVPARTFNDQIFFTTYTPSLSSSTDPCKGVGSGTNRSYVISVFNGSSVLDANKDGTLTTDERSQDLSQGGIAPETTFLFPADDGTNGDGTQSGGETGGSKGPVICLKGVEVLSACTNYDRRKKTYWREGTAN